MNYDVALFVEIIESIQGVIPRGTDFRDGIQINKYVGPAGRLVLIDMSIEDITPRQGKGYLRELGLDHLIQALFPD